MRVQCTRGTQPNNGSSSLLGAHGLALGLCCPQGNPLGCTGPGSHQDSASLAVSVFAPMPLPPTLVLGCCLMELPWKSAAAPRLDGSKTTMLGLALCPVLRASPWPYQDWGPRCSPQGPPSLRVRETICNPQVFPEERRSFPQHGGASAGFLPCVGFCSALRFYFPHSACVLLLTMGREGREGTRTPVLVPSCCLLGVRLFPQILCSLRHPPGVGFRCQAWHGDVAQVPLFQ